MLFHEIYGKYYQTVTKILQRASEKGRISQREIRSIVAEHAFLESGMYIPEAMSNSWFLLDKAGGSVLRNAPSVPLTTTEKRWMKAILLDPRIQLFSPDEAGLENVSPLFTPDMFFLFDRYEDGDPFDSPAYIQNFRLLLQALVQNRKVKLQYSGSNGEQIHICIPYRLEYSEKDDKFRLLAILHNKPIVLNLAKLLTCELLEPADSLLKIPTQQKSKLVLELQDYRNALERAMLHFSHLEKETERLGKGKYRITLWYAPRDERELLIRILSFGPLLKVVEPDSVVSQIKYRIEKQKNRQTP